MTDEELRTLPDHTLIYIARNVKHYEAKEDRDELILELARRLDAYAVSGPAMRNATWSIGPIPQPANYLLDE